MKLQEKLIQDMEKAVSRRDTIVTRGDAQSKMNKKVETKGAFQKKLLELRKKIKETQQVRVHWCVARTSVTTYLPLKRLAIDPNRKSSHQLKVCNTKLWLISIAFKFWSLPTLYITSPDVISHLILQANKIVSKYLSAKESF